MHFQAHRLPTQPRSTAINDFHQARMKAALQQVTAALTGKSVELLSYEDVAHKLRATGRTVRGLQSIPVQAIVGSVGRYTDFTRSFLPLSSVDPHRWASVKTAAPYVTQLPPIDVYQIGEAYFVLDGNHRVAIARRDGISHLDAFVTEVRTRVPLSPDIQPDELIIMAEYADFLEHTRLDQLRPGADLRVSVPGQYTHLENHIEVHRYFLEIARDCDLCDEDAVCCWYDDAYTPMVTAIREQGILRYFPGRTETDFYVWLATHQAALRNQLGWEVKPETLTKFASQFEPQPEHPVARVGKKILDVVVPRRWKGGPRTETWSQERLLARYSQHLFADILVPLGSWEGECRALEQALIVAGHEEAQVCGLYVVAEENERTDPKVRASQDEFCRRCQSAGIQGQLAVEVGRIMDKICERSVLTDLVILDRDCPSMSQNGGFPSAEFTATVQHCSRPVLVVLDQPSPLSRVLLAYDDGPKAREALFVAAYLAEQWGVDLVVLAVLETGQTDKGMLSHARQYLDLHEVQATYIVETGAVAEFIIGTAAAHGSELIILGGSGPERTGRKGTDEIASQVLRECKQPVLICP
jgi:nucleotide-binding universal stress UspA family protein